MNQALQLLTKANTKLINHVRQTTRRFLSAQFENNPYDLHMLETGPPTTAELTKEDGMQFFRVMTLIRRMENEMANLYKKKEIRGFCHLYSGQEAVGAGINAVLLPQDTVITSYRCHGWMILLTNEIKPTIAELLGRNTGCARGKGGSMHMYSDRLFGGNGIVGAHVPLGTGLALGHQYKQDGGVSVTLYGDGASNQGQTYEAMNIAKLKNLPVLYVAENNIYAMGTSVSRHSANPHLYARGPNIPGIRLDGMDVLSVREGAKFCLDYVRSGNGPIILETLTYRYFGHSMSDPGTSYRSREEVQQIRETKDPIKLLRNRIISSNFATEDELKTIDKEIKQQVEKAVMETLKDGIVEDKEVSYDIYCDYKGKVVMPGFNKFIEHKNAGVFKPANIK